MGESIFAEVQSALFVDFDNIFLTLSELDDTLGKQFGMSPDKWLAWLEREMPRILPDPAPVRRRILIRRCYLNPQAFGAFRPYFIRSAFEVVDCPPLTAHGKTSTDIHMVMDILDALNHVTRFNEFIILSGDADFTPVLLRLRMHNRYSAVLSAGYASPAYRASCDYLISQDEFMRDALGIRYHDEDAVSPAWVAAPLNVPDALLNKMAARLYEAAIVPTGVEASQLPGVYKEFPEFKQSNHWLGFYSLRSLTEAIVAKRQDLVIIEEDPWRVARAEHTPRDIAGTKPLPAELQALQEKEQADVRRAIAEWIKGIVAESKTPVIMALLAQGVTDHFGKYIANTEWLGAGSFKALLSQLDLGGLGLISIIPGYVYDPERHELPSPASGSEERTAHALSTEPVDNFSIKYPELAPLARKVHQLTDTPYLMPEHYALLLEEIAREVNDNSYHLTRTSRTVRDRCVEKGAPIARSHASFALIGLHYSGYRLGQELPETARRLGEALLKNILNLCRTAQFNLNDQEQAQLREWIVGALAPPYPDSQPEPSDFAKTAPPA